MHEQMITFIYNISIPIDMTSNISLFKALGEETSYRIIVLLTQRGTSANQPVEYCACEIPSLIKRTQSNTSMHLTKLQEWGIIKSRREGKRIIYSIKDKKIGMIFKVLGYPENKLTKSCCCTDKRIK